MVSNQNKLRPPQIKHIKIIRKLIFGCLVIFLGIPLAIAYSPIFLSGLVQPDLERTQELLMLIAKHSPHGKLIYSKSDSYLPSLCLVYKYPEGHYNNYSDLKVKYNYLNQNKDYDGIQDYYFNVKENKGCSNFLSQFDTQDIEQFIEVSHYSEYGRGSKTFINKKYRLIMFEGYLYD